tara:strand:- start:684 stop:1091 length:408 start_codon:yes stop_codon:yes gene_type:complete
MGSYVAGQIVKKIIAENRNIKDSRVLVMGVTFKEDVADIRNSKVVDVVKELQSFGVNVDAIDPFASIEEVKEEYGYDMVQIHSGKYDAVIVAVQDEEYRKLTEKYFKELLIDNGLFVDLKGIFKDEFKGVNYWSL